ncbi:fucosyltransferase [Trichinella spiralis]|uniref:Fucosyltransferase n=1 Tax=Trichinella spiralis TaxID=6334 RepID=A0ABR3KX83_TRISP
MDYNYYCCYGRLHVPLKIFTLAILLLATVIFVTIRDGGEFAGESKLNFDDGSRPVVAGKIVVSITTVSLRTTSDCCRREAPPQLFAPTLGVGNFFDHSVTYMPISWFHCPYGMVVKKKKKKSESSGEESSTRREQQPNNRTRLAFWIASKCSTHSGREWLVERLARYIPIDTYGACGTLPLTREAFDHDQQRSLAKLYKFRIVFENTVCRHYMTERFFEALIDGSVPVVLRRADYEPIAPEHSFIAVDDFHSAQQLADYLNFCIPIHANTKNTTNGLGRPGSNWSLLACAICVWPSKKKKRRRTEEQVDVISTTTTTTFTSGGTMKTTVNTISHHVLFELLSRTKFTVIKTRTSTFSLFVPVGQ